MMIYATLRLLTIYESAAEAQQFVSVTVQGGALFLIGFAVRGAAAGVRSWWRRET